MLSQLRPAVFVFLALTLRNWRRLSAAHHRHRSIGVQSTGSREPHRTTMAVSLVQS